MKRFLLIFSLAFVGLNSFAEVIYDWNTEEEFKINKTVFHTNDENLNVSVMDKFNFKSFKKNNVVCATEKSFISSLVKEKSCNFFTKKNKAGEIIFADGYCNDTSEEVMDDGRLVYSTIQSKYVASKIKNGYDLKSNHTMNNDIFFVDFDMNLKYSKSKEKSNCNQ